MNNNRGLISRRTLLGAFAGIPALSAAPSFAGTSFFNRGAGDVRRISMRSARTGETVNMIYWVEGEYIREALREINWFMRDWRENEPTSMDVRTIDIIAATHRLLETSEPYHLVSGYRSLRTNEMLRRKSRGVARNSYHTKGMAVDLKLSSRSVSQMGRAARACRAGGVGTYGRSQFVHLDCGPLREWRR